MVEIGAGGAQGAINAEWKCKQRVWAFQLACDVLPQPRRNHRCSATHVEDVTSHGPQCVYMLSSRSCRLAFVSRCDV